MALAKLPSQLFFVFLDKSQSGFTQHKTDSALLGVTNDLSVSLEFQKLCNFNAASDKNNHLFPFDCLIHVAGVCRGLLDFPFVVFCTCVPAERYRVPL